MAKIIVRETIIILLLCLAIILILGVVLYNYVPTNKILPEQVSYKQSQEVKSAIEQSVSAEDSQVILTYQVDATDLDNYEKMRDYHKGKTNPFSSVKSENEGTSSESNQTNSENTATNKNTSTNTNNIKNNKEDNSIQDTENRLFPDKGIK